MTNPTTWSCYGKLWDSSRTECTGGFDLAFSDPKTRSAKRAPCSAAPYCQPLTLSRKQEQQLIPPQQLAPRPPIPAPPMAAPPPMLPHYGAQQPVAARPPAPPPVIPTPPQTQTYYGQQPYYYGQAQQYAQHYPQHAHYLPPALAQFGPMQVPVAYQAQGAQMPAYLAVPEPMDGAVWWSRLGRELVRAMAKAFGHAMASFFDHNPMRLHQPPPAAPPVQPQALPPTA